MKSGHVLIRQEMRQKVTESKLHASCRHGKVRFYDWPVGLEIRWAQNLRALLRPGTGALRWQQDTILPLAGGFGNSVGRKICEHCCARGRARSALVLFSSLDRLLAHWLF